jgi:metallo-beta-lactamase class B
MKMRLKLLAVALLAFAATPYRLRSEPPLPPCESCATWNKPQVPFKIYGNTYYVGPHGLSSILITSDAGLVLIDGAIPESAPLIAANIRTLGFRVEDVKFILNSHAHFDHAGGIAELQRLSGAQVAVSPWSADVLSNGGVGHGDPQLGEIRPIAKVARVLALHDGEVIHIGNLAMTAHFTPGHTPGGTSWTWKSCEDGRCLDMVYADSLSPISADGFKFTNNADAPNAIQGFEKSFAFLSSTPCDILLTPHGEASGFWDHLEARYRGVTPDPMIDSSACRKLADRSREALAKRIAAENAH